MGSLFRNLGLRTKIRLTVAVLLLSFLALATLLTYRQQRELLIGEAVDKARIIASEAIRTREYLSDHLQRGGIEFTRDRYGLTPVVASTRIGERVARDLGYTIRQVSDRYRNPKNAADPYESEMLDRFKANPALTEAFSITEMGGTPVFRYLQPFHAEESCLQCHGDPADAPPYIKELFPEQEDRAYYYKIGEVRGAASVAIPMAGLYGQLYDRARNDALITAGLFLALALSLGLLVRVTVIGPIGRLGEGISGIMRTGRFDRKIPLRGRDEIGVLIEGFNQMMEDLQRKTEHLEESERRFQVLTETASDGIVSFLSNGQIILFNRQAERIFGYGKGEVLGVSIDRLVHEECPSLHATSAGAYLRERGDELLEGVHSLPGRRRDGTRLELELSLSAAESDGHRFYTAILRERS